MVRITPDCRSLASCRILIEGRLTQEAVAEIRRLATECSATGKSITIDLSGVTSLEPSTVPPLKALRDALAEGSPGEACGCIRFIGGSAYVNQLLQELKP